MASGPDKTFVKSREVNASKNRAIWYELKVEKGDHYITPILYRMDLLNQEWTEKKKLTLKPDELRQIPFLSVFKGKETPNAKSFNFRLPRTVNDKDYFNSIYDYNCTGNRWIRLCVKQYENGVHMFVKGYEGKDDDFKFIGWIDFNETELQKLMEEVDIVLGIIDKQELKKPMTSPINKK